VTTAAYDAIAEWYDVSLRAGSLIHDLALPAVWDLAGPLGGRRICDLACGQGIVARQLAARGATVVGVDISDKLLFGSVRYHERRVTRRRTITGRAIVHGAVRLTTILATREGWVLDRPIARRGRTSGVASTIGARPGARNAAFATIRRSISRPLERQLRP